MKAKKVISNISKRREARFRKEFLKQTLKMFNDIINQPPVSKLQVTVTPAQEKSAEKKELKEEE